MQGINSLLNSPPHPQISLQDLHSQIQNQPPMHFDSSSGGGGGGGGGGGPHDDFLQQMLSATPSWSPNDENHSNAPFHFDESAALASKLRHHQISSPSAAKLLLHHQFLTSRSAADYDTSFKSPNQGGVGIGDGALFNGFTGSLQAPNHPQQHFHHPQGGSVQNYAPPGPAAANQNPQASGSTGGAPAQPRQRVRARRGQATDPHSIAERLRRERIAERMKALQELVPNANKTDKASMLDEIIDYVKFLQLQVKVLSMSRLGGAGAVAPLLADISAQARGGGGGGGSAAAGGGDSCVQTAEAEDDGLTVTESQVAKLMEEDMGSAMQYLQGKGLCLMPISLATAISTRNNPMNFINNNPGPPSPSISALTVQSAAVAAASDGNVKDATSVSKP